MRTIPLLLLLAACNKDETDPTDDTVDSTDTTDTTDTTSTTDTTDTPGSTGIIPTAALMEIGIAYDPATDSAVGFTDEAGAAQMPYVRLALGSNAWNGEWSDTGDYCTFELTSAAALPRAADLPADVMFGVQFAAGTPYTSDCNELVDPDRIGDIESRLTALDFGFAWLPTVFPDFGRELVQNGQLTADDLNRFIGGGITGRFAAPDPLLPTALTSGYVTDDTFHIQVDDMGDGVRRTRTEMVVDGALTKGVYRMQLFIPADQVLNALTP